MCLCETFLLLDVSIQPYTSQIHLSPKLTTLPLNLATTSIQLLSCIESLSLRTL